MINKKGFAFVETIVVLTLVTLTLTMLLASYSLIVRKSNEKENYNKPSDKYLLSALLNLGTNSECDSTKNCDYLSVLSGKSYVKITPNSCDALGDIFISGEECKKVLEDLNVKNIYLVSDIQDTLKYKSDTTAIFDNGTIEYMKTLKKCKNKMYVDNKNIVKNPNEVGPCEDPIKYIIGVFYKYDKYYFASIPLNE